MQNKKELRTEIKRKIKEIPEEEFISIGKKIFTRIQNLESYKRANNVFCFVSMPSEPYSKDFLKIVLEDGKNLYTPKVTDDGMIAVKTDNLALNEGRFGIFEPNGNEDGSGNIDLAIIPCLAMAQNGKRLGRGGGYYDRFLAKYKKEYIAVCPEALLLNDLPTETHDKPVKIIATENRIIRI